MNRLRCLSILLAMLLFTLSAHVGLGAEPARPNVLIILTDDMGFGELTCYGKGSGVPTPHIDQLAREGARFTQYYTPAPVCSPSRAGLISGQFPSRLHLNNYLQTRAGNIHCEQNDYLDPKAAALPKAFKRAGYATAQIGKWHMGGGRDVDNAPSIGQYGFDEWAATWESPDPCPELGRRFAPWDRRTEPGQVVRHKRTEWMVNKTLDFMRRHKQQPCFVYLCPDDMHAPYRPSPEMQAKYGGSENEAKTPRKNYLGVLDEYDRQIGRLMDGLRESGLDKNTIVIFTSDNGPSPNFEHERTGGLRGKKMSLYEGGTRVPFIARWPGHIQPGTSDESSVLCGVDLAPTLCRMAGIDLGAEAANQIDGQDRSQVLLGRGVARTKALLWEFGRKKTGYGSQEPPDHSPNVAVREGPWKLLVDDNGTSRELYNITSDPKETADIAGKNPAVADKLSNQALTWRKTLPGRSVLQKTPAAAAPAAPGAKPDADAGE